ncbi:rRNA biogenesis protein rrp5 [Blastocladiella emersonii ATCC 22665]|nr:rRNA biogenesis protein rrp5 [Blastocladiella emersonii ATCC 22665]
MAGPAAAKANQKAKPKPAPGKKPAPGAAGKKQKAPAAPVKAAGIVNVIADEHAPDVPSVSAPAAAKKAPAAKKPAAAAPAPAKKAAAVAKPAAAAAAPAKGKKPAASAAAGKKAAPAAAAAEPAKAAPAVKRTSSEAFPRGKAPKTAAAAAASAANDAESGDDEPAAAAPAPKKKAKTEPKPAAAAASAAPAVKKIAAPKKSAEPDAAKKEKHAFNIAKVFADQKPVFGLVKDFKELDLVVALPGNQFGYVSVTEVSPQISAMVAAYAQPEDSDDEDEEKELPELRKYFTKGQPVLVKVTQIKVKDEASAKRLDLTLQPSLIAAGLTADDFKAGTIVQAAVRSEEDHGLILDLGLGKDEPSGFVPTAAIPAGRSFTVGQVALFKVTEPADGGRVITVAPLPLDAALGSDAFAGTRFAKGTVALPVAIAADARPTPPIAIGDVVRATIVEHSSAGMKVDLVVGDASGKKGKDAAATPAGPTFRGLVPSYHISDITLAHPDKRFPVGSKHKFRVLTVNGSKFSLTAKKTLVNSELPIVTDHSRDNVGRITHGVIVGVTETGVVVQFYNLAKAFIPISDMSHEFLKSTDDFKRGQPVKCRIYYANAEQERMKASLLLEGKKASDDDEAKALAKAQAKKDKADKAKLRKSERILQTFDWSAIPAATDRTSVADLHVDMDVEGYVHNIKDKAGVFVGLSPSVTGRIKIAELSDKFVRDWQSLAKVGDRIKCRVVAIDGNQVELSCKSRKKVAGSDVESEAESSDDEDAADAMEVDGMAALSDSSDDDDEDADDEDADEEEEEHEARAGSDEESDADDVDVVLDTQNMAKSTAKAGGIEVTKGFSWSNSMSDDEDEGADSDDEDADEDEDASGAAGAAGDDDAMDVDGESGEPSKAKLKRQKQKAKDEAERAVQQRQAAILQEPQLATDYERMLVGSPNSSFLWIKYMAFQLKLADVTKARQVAERAIQTIHYREEQEKLNVWVAWLNLENQFGDRESLDALFKRAVQYNDPRTVYLHLASIYTRSGKLEAAAELYDDMVAKFKESTTVWMRYATFLFEQPGRADEARALLPRALKSLAKAKHIAAITQMALLEFKLGDAERGRTIFEGVLANYPKRVDLWSVYLDMEVKSRDFDAARRLFDRIITLKFSSKKIKFFFKKYLEFEKKFGDDARVAYVKQRAVEYVESLNRE